MFYDRGHFRHNAFNLLTLTDLTINAYNWMVERIIVLPISIMSSLFSNFAWGGRKKPRAHIKCSLPLNPSQNPLSAMAT